MMEFYNDYVTRLESKDNDPELLEEFRQEAIRSLQADPPEQALTLTCQMVAALSLVAKHQEPSEHQLMDAINDITSLIADYLTKMGGGPEPIKRLRAGGMNPCRYNYTAIRQKGMLLKALSSILLFSDLTSEIRPA